MVGLLPLGVAVASCAPDVRSESKAWDRIKFALSRRHEQFISKFVAGVRRAALSAIETEAGRPRRPGSGLVGGPAKGATWFCADNRVLGNVRLKWVSLWSISLRNDFGHFRFLIRKRPFWRIHFWLLLDGHFFHILLKRVHLVTVLCWNCSSERRELKRVIWCHFLRLIVGLEVWLDDSQAFFFCNIS